MKIKLSAAFLLFLISLSNALANEFKAYKMPRTQVIPILESDSTRQYELIVKLPESYSKNTDKYYPVIYFTDAEWHIDILSAAAEYLMNDVILVGISWQKNSDAKLMQEIGSHVSRFRDYTIRESSNPDHQSKYQMGQASNHLDFIRDDVIKTIEKQYRTDTVNRTYFGYSAGAQFGAYILLTQTDTFNHYILGSPSLTKEIPTLSKLASKVASGSKDADANVFISHGSAEHELGESVQAFISLLKTRDDKRLNIHHRVIEGDHQTAFPLTALRSVSWLNEIQLQEN